ncbi:murein hydrolase activator EnvC family protein [Pseudoduganella aquatica]|uniref:Peptidoglycan DD-metalloendopeptidase family protein n=1 Tax=Pseudoduganella aquatica TaxID=2660641 RepID=A0A7X4KPK1_9BURK|nr:peptidoglycan DD-metalloendopeptidase family protein [Pseudoduganella aquatica]MYN10272.1 peptidoglycan DD-metalloendopeptidase family protein [Pseudoduganella aquatica]
MPLFHLTRRAGALALAVLLLAAVPAAHAAPAKPTERSKQKLQAEAERAGLQQKLNALRRDIGQTESAREDAADTLAESEEAISNANRSLRELAEEQSETNVRLQTLGAERARLQATVEQQKQQLAKLLREQYVAGNEDRIKLLLSGDNPNRINRDLQLMAYVSQAQARLLESLRANLRAVEANQADAQNARDELEEIAQEERQQKDLLVKEKAKRASVLASLSQRLVAQRKEAGKVAQDEQRMAGLVDKLGKLIEEQAKAAAAEQARLERVAAAKAAKAKADAEARALAQAKAREQARARADALAKARAEQAERERIAKAEGKPKPAPLPLPPAAVTPPQTAPANEGGKLEPIEVDESKVAAVKDEPPARKADIALAPAMPDGAFAALKGQLRPPVAGKVAARFGSKRGDGPSWKGMFIRAAEGADVHTVASGRVVHASWLRGFGNLIIVDHGGQYWSLYANNQSLLRRVGDVVKAGEVIAAAGNTGGNEESGLYFELRHKGKEFDPASWVKF